MEFTPGQCRAARALIGWSQDQLASASKVAKATIANFELGKRTPYDRTLDDLVAAIEAAGVEFTNGTRPGVRLTPVGALYQLADEANLDAVLKMKGMKGEVGNIAKVGKTPWTIAHTPTGIECRNTEGTTVGSVRANDGGLIFDPELTGVPFDDMPMATKLQNWIGIAMERDAEKAWHR
jgi:transcriptional regulator with XRE-family HTH domain